MYIKHCFLATLCTSLTSQNHPNRAGAIIINPTFEMSKLGLVELKYQAQSHVTSCSRLKIQNLVGLIPEPASNHT